MIRTLKPDNTIAAFRKLFFIIAFLFFTTVLVFCCFYLLSSYGHLVQWYFNLNNCFYRNQYWSSDFFTPGIKSDGNMYCIIGITVALAGVFYVVKHTRTWNKPIEKKFSIAYDTNDIIPVMLCLATSISLWTWGNAMSRPSYDEVFSAQNAAGIQPFQCISYYMLPNNHLLFNLLNNLVFHPFTDKIITGRIISLIAYLSIITLLFFWFKRLLQNSWLALLVSATLAMQFHVWGFSFQARGYELYLLAEWGLLISLFSYVFSNQIKWLYLNVFCSAAGYFCMPSFLYFHAALLLFMLLYGIFYKKNTTLFWKFQLAGILLAYLCYLPVLCFSGIEAITYNAYVLPLGAFINKSPFVFCQWMFPNFQPYINHTFSDIHFKDLPINLVLFLLPLILLFSRKNKLNRLFGLFYLSLWLVFFALVIFMKRLPFERNLIGHFSITLAGIVLVVSWFTGVGSVSRKIRSMGWALFSALLLLLAVHFMQTNETSLKTGLYDYDVNDTYAEINNELDYIPKGATVGFLDIDFYCYYLCSKKGYNVIKCPTGNEDYIVKQNFESLPRSANKYLLVKQLGDYEVYKRQ